MCWLFLPTASLTAVCFASLSKSYKISSVGLTRLPSVQHDSCSYGGITQSDEQSCTTACLHGSQLQQLPDPKWQHAMGPRTQVVPSTWSHNPNLLEIHQRCTCVHCIKHCKHAGYSCTHHNHQPSPTQAHVSSSGKVCNGRPSSNHGGMISCMDTHASLECNTDAEHTTAGSTIHMYIHRLCRSMSWNVEPVSDPATPMVTIQSSESNQLQRTNSTLLPGSSKVIADGLNAPRTPSPFQGPDLDT